MKKTLSELRIGIFAGALLLVDVSSAMSKKVDEAGCPPNSPPSHQRQKSEMEESRIIRLLEDSHGVKSEQDGLSSISRILKRLLNEDLPLRPAMMKIEEGLTKGLPFERIAAALEKQNTFLFEAQRIVSKTRKNKHGFHSLIVSSAFALESGVKSNSIEMILKKSDGEPPGSVKGIIAAAELLCLKDYNPECRRIFINDCIVKKLKRHEIIRAVDVLTSEGFSSKPYLKIRDEFWDSFGTTPPNSYQNNDG